MSRTANAKSRRVRRIGARYNSQTPKPSALPTTHAVSNSTAAKSRDNNTSNGHQTP